MTSQRLRAVRLLPLLLCAATACVAADGFTPQMLPSLAITRAAGPIAIDGRLDDAGWVGAARAAGFSEIEPNEQARPPVDTEVLVTYDDDNLYVAFICADDPAQVRATYAERDQIFDDDCVFLLLDTYGAQQWAYEICANPYGVQGDLLFSANGGEDAGYDLIYHTAGRTTARGYEVEMAVPFASLRFPDRPAQTWRIDFWRNRPRAVRGQYAWAAQSRDNPCWPCQWGTVTGIADVKPGNGLELLPAWTARQTGRPADDGRFADGDLLGEPSLGARYALSSQLTAEASFNPDFSQVESDAAQIDVNSAFALAYPEKRPFFQEGSDLFVTPFTALYTRSINDPDVAVKLMGRPDHNAVAFLSAIDANTPVLLPFEDGSALVAAGRSWSNIVRLKHAWGQESQIGAIATDRRLAGGGAGSVAGADGLLRLGRNYRFSWQALASRTAEPDDPGLTADLAGVTFDGGRHTAVFDGETYTGRALYGSFQRRARHWNLNLDYWERSPTFRADSGFEPQNDRREVWVINGYNVYFDRGLLRRLSNHLYVYRAWNFAGDVKNAGWQADVAPQLRWAQLSGHVQYTRENELFEGAQFDGVWLLHSCFDATLRDGLAVHFGATRSHQIARRELRFGDQTDLSASLYLRPLDRVSLELSHVASRSVDPLTGGEFFDGTITRGRLGLQVTRELSARLVAQYNSFARTWEVDPLVTYRLSPFSIFYAGSTRDYARFAVAENGPEQWDLAERTYFVKLQYLFRP
ncbi:MAG: carbohydrate binding family 9 domain-containing protein [Candidatus Krumholzibacteriia bacterium]